MGVPKRKRKESKFEAQHHFIKLRSEVTTLMLLDFGFSEEKYLNSIERYRETHNAAQNVDEVVARYKKKCDSFNKWFIDKECDVVLKILQKIDSEFTAGNSIYPSETPAKIMEFCERRKHVDEAIAQCYVLKQENNMKVLYKELFGKELIWKKQSLNLKTAHKLKQKSMETATLQKVG